MGVFLMLKQKKRFLYVFVLVLSLLLVSCKKNPTKEIDPSVNLQSLKNLYQLSEDYIGENLGSDYALWGFDLEIDKKNGTENVEFIYTKRTEPVRDVCFVRIDISNAVISSQMQSEANRLYGSDIILTVDGWTIDDIGVLLDVPCEWDRADAETTHNNLKFRFNANDTVVYTYEIDPVSGETVGEIG